MHVAENAVKTLELNAEQGRAAFERLAADFRVIAPVARDGGGRFSDTDVVMYDEVGGFDQIEFDRKSYFSPKSALLPTRETLFTFSVGRIEPAESTPEPTLLFLRACDIHALRVLDAHFLESDDIADVYYQRRHEAVKIVLMECPTPFPSCFCVSMGTNRAEHYDAFLRPREDGYIAGVRDDVLASYFPEGTESAAAPRFPTQDPAPLSVPDEVDDSVFEAPLWKEYTRRCIACGRCNVCCPTCTCFTMRDLPSTESPDEGCRRRVWSACQVKKFGLLAGNHEFRIPEGDRMRYRVLHKIRDFRKRTGFNMCVGCGRCDDVCPEYISMRTCVEKINECCCSPDPVGA